MTAACAHVVRGSSSWMHLRIDTVTDQHHARPSRRAGGCESVMRLGDAALGWGTRVLLHDDDTSSQNHFKIGEVAELVGVRPHVLRYWEQEFPLLRPKKTRGAHRHYSRANLALARAIHALVVDQGYSIAGARKRLDELGRPGASLTEAATVVNGDSPRDAHAVSLRDELLAVRDDLQRILAVLDAPDPEPMIADEARRPHDPYAESHAPTGRETAHVVVHTAVSRDVPRRR